MARILLVYGDQERRRGLAASLNHDHHEVWEHSGVEDARGRISTHRLDVVLVAHKLASGESADVVAAAREMDAAVSAIILFEAAEHAVTGEAFDALVHPFNPEVVRVAVQRASERTRLLRENYLLKRLLARVQEAMPAVAGQGIGSDDEAPVGATVDLAVAESFDLTAVLEKKERDLIVRMLSLTGGAQAEAARRMGLSRSALAYKLNKYGIRADSCARSE